MTRDVVRVPGWVWCDKHGEIHEETSDPYGYGPPRYKTEEDMRCVPAEDHQPIFRLSKRRQR